MLSLACVVLSLAFIVRSSCFRGALACFHGAFTCVHQLSLACIRIFDLSVFIQGDITSYCFSLLTPCPFHSRTGEFALIVSIILSHSLGRMDVT